MNLDLAAHYVLVNDIDASDTVNWNGGAGFDPIGDSPYYPVFGTPFMGSFDGKEYKITDLYIDAFSAAYVGLFGGTQYSDIKNVGLEDIEISGTEHVGGLVGITIDSTISNSYTTGTISSNPINPYFHKYTGGLIGHNYHTIILNSYSTCNVQSVFTTGGLVGLNIESSILNSYATGSVTRDISNPNIWGNVGGLVGFNYHYSSITNSFATGSVSGTDGLGGLVGRHGFGSLLSDSYATGSVSGNRYVGGLVGITFREWEDPGSIIMNSYSTGSVSGIRDIGGLVSFCRGVPVLNSYWDIQTSGQSSSAGGIGKTTAQMKNQITYHTWDFRDTWRMEQEVTYPHLWFQFPHWDQYPIANAGCDKTVIVDEEFSFDGSGSYDPLGGIIVNYEWDFGDSNSGLGATPTHTYEILGTYYALLTVTDDDGYKDTETVKIHVNARPTADAGFDQIAIVGESVYFNGDGSYDVDGTIVTYEWDFGDTNTGSGVFPSHQYNIDGIYTVILTVTDDDSATGSDTVTITVITPIQAIQNLILEIEELELPKGTENNLIQKLNDAIHLHEMGNINGVIHKLGDFIDYVNAQIGKKITQEQADFLIEYVQWILDNL
jgi:chitodextrinase